LFRPATSGSGCESQDREVFANLADKSQAWCPQVMGSEGDLSRWVNCYTSYAGTEPRLPAETRDRLADELVVVRDRVVVVVGGVMSIPGDGNAVHKAKDHSHE
jgi:hypothetical protein